MIHMPVHGYYTDMIINHENLLILQNMPLLQQQRKIQGGTIFCRKNH